MRANITQQKIPTQQKALMQGALDRIASRKIVAFARSLYNYR
ncbi:hypothetical protein [Dickeya lacustris]|uniref:Uncharacterized protein n=1 Tax=Dickeya lacustris TaxID=2259638 RepID=A0ABY8G8Z1_9GAMM|nr:hypothetical protein [Dickeya lacustris]WFN56398.1 hypothetical protein O1Q98_03590 [Dickeya lacustris]